MGRDRNGLTENERQGIRTRVKIGLALSTLTKRNGRPPTLRELCIETGVRSKGAMWIHLRRLCAMGVVRHEGGTRGYIIRAGWWPRLFTEEVKAVGRAKHQ